MGYEVLIDETTFWRWAFADHLSKTQRGVLAEFIVGEALGATQNPRIEWDQYDLVTPEGVSVEVKSAAYLQSWEQQKPSEIQFDIAHKHSWDSNANTIATEKLRPADVYVFCVLQEANRDLVNPLDVRHWFFLIASTSQLAEWFGDQKSVRLSVLEGKGLARISYVDLESHVKSAASASK